MWINSLSISDLRVIRSLELQPREGINFVCGPNGAGKTTILEAIYLAGRGQSFRHQDAGPMIRNGSDDATVVVKMVGAGGRQAILGVRRSAKNVECRLNGENVSKRSALAMALPVQWIGSQPQLLLSMGPEDVG